MRVLRDAAHAGPPCRRAQWRQETDRARRRRRAFSNQRRNDGTRTDRRGRDVPGPQDALSAGDEAELFRLHFRRLVRLVQRDAGVPEAVGEDCASLAFLRVSGLRYREIQRRLGVTYTWVNRHVSEGRAQLRSGAGS